mgnify:CR=1 FL=1
MTTSGAAWLALDGGSEPSRPLVGRLRLAGGGFADDRGALLPVVCHDGDLLAVYHRDPARGRAHLDQMAKAGYLGPRYWTVLTGPFWEGYTIGPWLAGYWGTLYDFHDDLAARGLAAIVSQGDLGTAVEAGQIESREGFMRSLGGWLGLLPATVAMVDGGNEAWQTGTAAPADLARIVAACLLRCPGALATLTSPPGETADELNVYSLPPSTMGDVHGSRDGRWWDMLRHVRNVVADPTMPLTHRHIVQSEPFGPGSFVSGIPDAIKGELTSEVMAAAAVVALMHRQPWVYFAGIEKSSGLLEQQPGFWSTPPAVRLLPPDIMRWPTFVHGGAGQTMRIFAVRDCPGPCTLRADHVFERADGSGRFACIVYGPNLSDHEQVRTATITSVTPFGDKAILYLGQV